MRREWFGVVVVLAVALVAGAGCMKCGERASKALAEKAIEGATGGKAKVDLGGGTVDISGLPELLRYPGAVAKGRWSVTTEEGTGTTYVLETADAAATVINHYKTALAGWKSTATVESESGTVMMFGSPDEKQFVTVNVAREGTKTTISVMFITK